MKQAEALISGERGVVVYRGCQEAKGLGGCSIVHTVYEMMPSSRDTCQSVGATDTPYGDIRQGTNPQGQVRAHALHPHNSAQGVVNAKPAQPSAASASRGGCNRNAGTLHCHPLS